jgi:hypothetical protein
MLKVKNPLLAFFAGHGLSFLALTPCTAADDFDQNALDCDAAGVKCPRRVVLDFDRSKSDFVAQAGISPDPKVEFGR